ncbi:MAG: hypothetical protein ACRDGA_05745 [Bacteroidota bacterium]
MRTNSLKPEIQICIIVMAFALCILGCDSMTISDNALPPAPPNLSASMSTDQPVSLKRAEVKSYIEEIVTQLASVPEAANSMLLKELQVGPVRLNKVAGFENFNAHVLIEEAGSKHEVVLSLFSGSSVSDPSSSLYFAIDPDRFVEPGGELIAYKNPGLTSNEVEQTVLKGLTAQTAVSFPLVFVDIQEIIDPDQHVAILNELIRNSKIYQENGIMEVPCEDPECGGGGGGGGGGSIIPGYYLVLTGIQLKWDHDTGDDECEFYIREGSNGTVRLLASHRFTGGYWTDAAGRNVRYPDLNNTGDSDFGIDIALWPLSDQTPVSIVGIEDDLNGSKHDSYEIYQTLPDGSTTRQATMYNEYRRPENQIFTNVPRIFAVYKIPWPMDQDDIWQNSHFANFTLSNTPETETWHELQDFKIRVKKAYIF